MERVFSVDDILGTFWKLHTQSDEAAAAPVETAASNASSTGSLLGLLHQGMNRSASEWAFHEFLKEHQASLEHKAAAATATAAAAATTAPAAAAAADHDEEDDNVPEMPAKLPQLFSIHEESGAVESEEAEEAAAAAVPAESEEVELKENKLVNPLFSGFSGDSSTHRPSPHDPKQYEVYLKHRLDLACAAFALSKSSHNIKTKLDSTSTSDGPLGIPALPPKPELHEQRHVGTSGSSREHSEDDEDLSTVENSSDPNVVKRMRRMLSNRESARRSRRRKQAHMSDLEMQVAQLRVENSSLMKKLNDVNKNYSEAAVDNRVLKSDVEALRAKVKMAEDMVERAASNGPTRASKQRQQHQQGNKMNRTPSMQQQQGNKMNRTPSMQRVASLEHLQKRIRGAQS